VHPILLSVRAVALCVAVVICFAASADAAGTCTFDTSGATMRLMGDCTTDATLLIPEGMTLDGRGFTIAATDPVGGHFVGAVVMNGGGAASIVNTHITAQALTDVCDGGPSRLRGIFFDGATGTIRGNRISDVNQGPSQCQEGNAIEVRNLLDDEDLTVQIDHNVVQGYQKTGIVITGGVDAWIHDNRIGASANQELLPTNGIQIGYGAWALVTDNQIAGNSWIGYPATADAATAVLLFRAAPGTTVTGNTIRGNADIAIYIAADDVVVQGNEVIDEGPDLGGYDVGIGDYGTGNRVDGNTVRGYRIPQESLTGVAAKTIATLQ
jgi:hypothetical protein